MTNDQPLTEHQKAIVRQVRTIAEAHGVTLNTSQYLAALDLIGDVDIRDVAAAVPQLKLREKFPYPSVTWNPIKDAIVQKKEERLQREKRDDKAGAATALGGIERRMEAEGGGQESRAAIQSLLDDFWATHGGRPAPTPQRRVPTAMSRRQRPSLTGPVPFPTPWEGGRQEGK